MESIINSMFFGGFIGSLSVEIATYNKLVSKRSRGRNRYSLNFLLVLIALACVGGILAVAYGINKRILAFHIGASAPLLIEQFFGKK